MRPLRYRWLWLMLGMLLLVAGVFAAMAPMPARSLLEVNDKVVHATVFLCFMVWFSAFFRPRLWPLLFLALVGYGILIELLQGLTVARMADPKDVVADTVGLVLGWLLAAAGLSRWCEVVESWLVRRRA